MDLHRQPVGDSVGIFTGLHLDRVKGPVAWLAGDPETPDCIPD
jgi:hypothetical protein